MLIRAARDLTVPGVFAAAALACKMLGMHPPLAARGTFARTLVNADAPVVHAAGAPAQRALIYPQVLAAYATVDNGVSHVAAASGTAITWARDGELAPIFPGLANIFDVGPSQGPPNAEAALALKADAVFSWGYLAGPLERAGVPHVVEVSSNAANRRTSELNAWRAIGAVTGHASRVRTLIAADDAVRHDIALRVAARGSHVRRPTYVLLSLSRRFGGSGIYLAELPAFAGFALAPAAGTFTLEKLLAADPDVILIDQNLDPDTPAALAAQPGWDAVRAVREHRVYVLPAHSLFDGAVDDRVLLPWLDEVAHLGTVHDNVRADVAALYRDVFGRTASAADIDVYLSSRVNRSSVGVP